MKQFLYIFLYLNIYTGFLCEINAQKLYLTIEAEKTISNELLDSLNIQSSFKNYLSLRKEVDSLHFTLEDIGYIENELQSLQKKNDSSYLATYYLGKRYRTIQVFYSDKDFSKKDLLQVSSEITDSYFILSFNKIESSLQKLNTLKTKEGDSFARLQLVEIKKNKDSSLNAKLVLISGQKRTIDQIVVKGYEKFPKSYLKYYAGVRKGETFNKEHIITQSEALNSLGFVTNIKPPESFLKKTPPLFTFILKNKNIICLMVF